MFLRDSHYLSQIITCVYLFILAVACGVIIALGALSAPVIFHAPEFISQSVELSRFQLGQVMSEIFVRSGYIFIFVAVFIVVYELFSYSVLHSKKRFIVFGGIAAISLLLFTLYYMPAILELQKSGEEATASAVFDSLHQQSVWTFNMALISMACLFGSRVLMLGAFRR